MGFCWEKIKGFSLIALIALFRCIIICISENHLCSPGRVASSRRRNWQRRKRIGASSHWRFGRSFFHGITERTTRNTIQNNTVNPNDAKLKPFLTSKSHSKNIYGRHGMSRSRNPIIGDKNSPIMDKNSATSSRTPIFTDFVTGCLGSDAGMDASMMWCASLAELSMCARRRFTSSTIAGRSVGGKPYFSQADWHSSALNMWQ